MKLHFIHALRAIQCIGCLCILSICSESAKAQSPSFWIDSELSAEQKTMTQVAAYRTIDLDKLALHLILKDAPLPEKLIVTFSSERNAS